MILYRVEHPDTNIGPWQHGGMGSMAFQSCPETGHHPSDGPSPQQDGLGNLRCAEKCACVDLDQMRLWFRPSHVATLEARGFVLRKIKADDHTTRVGGWQAIFHDDTTAERIDTLPVTTLLNPIAHT